MLMHGLLLFAEKAKLLMFFRFVGHGTMALITSFARVKRFMMRLSDSSRRVHERDKMWLLSLDISFIESLLLPLFVALTCLIFLDTYSTILAIGAVATFSELNPIAAALFGQGFWGFLTALILKYAPILPIFYAVFIQDKSGQHEYGIRLVKFSALIALVASNMIYLYIVVLNNIPLLIEHSIRSRI